MATSISILGCGWLGLPLAYRLLQEGYTVKGSTTRTEKLPSLKDLGIAPYLLTLTPQINGQKKEEFFQSDILILDIPPQVQKQGEDFHPAQIRHIIDALKQHAHTKVIYTSSTSVYPTEGHLLTEEMAKPDAPGANTVLLQAESLLQEALGDRLSILRFGGLMGYDRISGKWSRGTEVADTPVNYLHRDDAVAIIVQLIEQQKWGKVYNAVAPQHPSRAEIYQKNAQAFGWPPAKVVPADGHKTICAQKLAQELQYNFIFPNPVEFSYNPAN